MALLRRFARLAGARASRRLGRSVPLVGTAVALALAASSVRRKGLARGVADTGLNALPLVGTLKAMIETFTGDWFADRPRRR
jgi:hypothetical protein